MKKSILSLFAVVLFSQFSVGQNIKFGFKGGANYSTFNVNGVDSSTLTSYHVGAILEFKTPIIGFQPELLYSSQGAVFAGNDVKLNYISVPLVVKFYVTKLSFDLGPQFSYLVSDNIQNGSSFGVKNSDIGVLGGVSVDIIGGLFAQARYVVGLSNNSNFGGGKNNVFQLSVGYKL